MSNSRDITFQEIQGLTLSYGLWRENLIKELDRNYELSEEGDLELDLQLKPKYEFETYIRPFDGVEVEAVSGIPAEEFQKIKLPNKMKDLL